LFCNDLTFFSTSGVILVLFLFSIVFVVGVVLLIVCFAFLRWSERSKRKSVSSRAQIEEPTAKARECFSASTLYLTVFSLIKHFVDGVFLFMKNIENSSFFLCAAFCCVLGFRV
jgi:heme O synthase-like polyprenyltransferase